MKKAVVVIGALAIVCGGWWMAAQFLSEEKAAGVFSTTTNQNVDAVADYDLLLLVNQDHPLPADYQVALVEFGNFEVARVMEEDLLAMWRAAGQEDVDLMLNSAYRSRQEQSKIFNDTLQDYIQQGFSQTQALVATKEWVAEPGSSEHETGLAIDFDIASGGDEGDMKSWIWLSQNAHRFGFIQRYPEDKIHLTGIAREQWHYRYVGKVAAWEIYAQGLVLEEYLDPTLKQLVPSPVATPENQREQRLEPPRL